MEKLEYHHNGVVFHIRPRATRGDQYEMHAAMAENADIENGRVIRTRPAKLYPWLISRFVTGWSKQEPWSLDALMAEPAEPGDDLVLGLGAYILNHTGIAATAKDAELKNA